MPNRILRDWTDSERVNALTVQGERFFVRLIMKVDDYGRLYGNPMLLRAALFPLLTDEVRVSDISRLIAECVKAGLITSYEVASKQYVEIVNFKQRLDKAKEKYPPPPISTESVEFVTDFPAETKRKETERKPKLETESESWDFVKENFKSVFEKWMRYKSSRREKYKSLESAELCYEKLLKFSNGDPVVAMDIVEDAMSKNYSGFFELKSNHQKKAEQVYTNETQDYSKKSFFNNEP